MFIKRAINGQRLDIELKPSELQEAYYEQEALFIKQECEELIYEDYGDKIKSGFIPFDELLEESIKRYKKYKEITEDLASDINSAVMDAYREVEDRVQARIAKEKPPVKAFVAFGGEQIGDKIIYYVQLENGDFSSTMEENIQTRSEAMFIAAQQAIELGLEIKEF